MPTLFNRLYAYSRTNKVPMLNNDHRSNLGVIVMQSFRKSGIDKKYTYAKAQPFDFDGYVVYYPKEFKEILDSLINDYYENPPAEPFVFIPPEKKVKKPKEIIQKQTHIPIKKRRKITKKGELVYSTKNQ